MKSAIIHDLPAWRVTSFGGGLAYSFCNIKTAQEVFLQGDAATDFREELDDNAELYDDYATLLAVLWDEYELIAC
jgi:hypothetical protein